MIFAHFKTFRQKIAFRLLFDILLFSSVITIMITATQLYIDYQRDVEAIDEQFGKIETLFKKPLTEALWFFNENALRLQLEGISSIRDIEYLELTGEKNISITVGQKFSNSIVENTIPLVYKSGNIDRKIGSLTIVASLTDVYSRLFDRLVTTLIAQGIKTFLVSIFIFLIFHSLVIKHLSAITTYLKKIDFDLPPQLLSLQRKFLQPGDELDQTVSSINIMAEKIYTSYGKIANELQLKQVAEEKLEHAYKEMERKVEQRTRELAEERDFSLSLINTAQTIILLLNPDGTIQTFNPYMAELCGYTLAEVQGENWFETFLPDQERQDIVAEFYKSLEDIPIRGFVNSILTKDGRKLSIEWHNKTLKNSAGKLIGLLAIGQDITEREQVEERLRNSEELLNVVGNIAKIGGWEMDLITRKAKWTRQTYDLVEIEYDQPIPGPDEHLEYYLPEYRAMITESLEKLIEENVPVDFSAQFKTAKGNTKWVRALGKGVWLDGKCIKIYGTLQDISQWKKEKEEKRIMEVKLRQAEKMETVGTLAGGIAHDFNNILSAIIGFSELVRDSIPADMKQTREDVDGILTASARAKNLVKQILTFSRKDQQDLQRIVPDTIIKESVKLLRATIPTSITIRQDIHSEGGAILAEPTKLQQIVINLCTNALQSMADQRGVLEIKFTRTILREKDVITIPNIYPGPFFMLSIRDTGSGIEKDTLERIFEPFYTTKEAGKGTGMGLAVVHAIVEDFGGTITVESEIGIGSIFTVYLPVTEEPDSQEVVQTIKHITVDSTSNFSIMIVDDEPFLLQINKRRLEQCGYKVTSFADSKEALEVFYNNPDQFDMLITDQTMPKLTGEDLAKSMLKIKPSLSVIMCTGHSDTVSEKKALSIGIKKYVLKPLQGDELLEAVRELLDGE